MQLKLKVTTEADTYEVSTNLFVIVAWERKLKTKASNLATGGIGIEDLAFMAYESCKTVNIPVPVSFDEYLKKLVNIEVVSDEPANPIEAALTPEA